MIANALNTPRHTRASYGAQVMTDIPGKAGCASAHRFRFSHRPAFRTSLGRGAKVVAADSTLAFRRISTSLQMRSDARRGKKCEQKHERPIRNDQRAVSHRCGRGRIGPERNRDVGKYSALPQETPRPSIGRCRRAEAGPLVGPIPVVVPAGRRPKRWRQPPETELARVGSDRVALVAAVIAPHVEYKIASHPQADDSDAE